MYNRVIMMGRMVADPELRQTQSGVALCRFRIAVNRPTKQGEEKAADFFEVVAWRNTAEFVSRYFGKGRLIHVEGRLQNDNYTDQNGVKHYSSSIVADNVAFCGDKSGNQQGGYQNQQSSYTNQYQPNNNQQNTANVQSGIAYGSTGTQGTVDMNDFEEILSDGETPF